MRQESLGRAAGDFIGYVQFFRDAPEGSRASLYDLRTVLLQHLDRVSASAAAQNLDPAEVDAARFALAAWADETILLSTWSGRDQWMNELLQMHLFATNKGGEEFYQRLEVLPPHFIEAREVFFLCLVHGFEGRLVGDDPARQNLLRQQYEMLRVGGLVKDSGPERVLAPPAYNLEIEVHGGGGRGVGPILMLWALGTLSVYGLFYLGLWLLSGGIESPPEF